MKNSGYTDCASYTCFEIAISNDMANPDLCGDCTDNGCNSTECYCLELDDDA